MSPIEKALFLKRWHGEHAIIQAKQCLAFNDFSEKSTYWKKVVEILSKDERPVYANSTSKTP